MRTRSFPICLTTGAIRSSKASPSARSTSADAMHSSRPAMSVENVLGGASTGVSCVAVMQAPCVVRVLVMEVDAGCDLAHEDERNDPVDACAERWPPACVADEVVTFLPEVLEAVSGVADDEQPGGSSDR